MESAHQGPLFSIIIPTRNRSDLFAAALRSVVEQKFPDREIIVVNDGSSEEEGERYRRLVAALTCSARLENLPATPRGHGHGFSLNYGAHVARGQYLCFLDDDDWWTDDEHLARVAGVVRSRGDEIDIVLANQRAFRNGVPIEAAVWIEDLEGHLRKEPDAIGSYAVTPAELLLCRSHCHFNTMVVRREHYLKIGGVDDSIRYEEDKEFFLRAIDRAAKIKFLPQIVSRHNVPDRAAKASLSTSESELSKRLYQLRVMDKIALFSYRPEVRRYALRQRVYALKHIATQSAREGRLDCARYYARQALMARFSVKWLGATILCSLGGANGK